MSTVLRSLRSSAIGTSTVNVGNYTAPSVTTGVVITGLLCVNRSGSTITVSVSISPGSDTQNGTFLVSGGSILPGGSLTLADEGNRLTLNATNVVQAASSLASSLDITMSVAEIT
jgi:hypothetical protein